jgi:hypothetical protein
MESGKKDKSAIMSRIYAINPTATGVAIDEVEPQAAGGFAPGYTALVPIQVGGIMALYAYNKATQITDVYTLVDRAPWVQPVGAKPDLAGPPWDNLAAFMLGNEPYLMTYERKDGTFGFFHVAGDLSVSKPYSFAFIRNTPTQGFTTTAAYTSLGQVFFTGYNFDTGIVANFSLVVTSSSTGGVPPLLAQNIWYHQWAKGWTRFAFFQLGGSNFFFKINTAKLNVNIDHMQDIPAAGSVEVGSYLQAKLPDALAITNCAYVPWTDGEPYLVTYIAPTGVARMYRIHADCQGWTELKAMTVEHGASQVIPYRISNQSFILLY